MISNKYYTSTLYAGLTQYSNPSEFGIKTQNKILQFISLKLEEKFEISTFSLYFVKKPFSFPHFALIRYFSLFSLAFRWNVQFRRNTICDVTKKKGGAVLHAHTVQYATRDNALQSAHSHECAYTVCTLCAPMTLQLRVRLYTMYECAPMSFLFTRKRFWK